MDSVEADEDITTWDGVEHYKKGDKVVEMPSNWDMNDSLTLPVGKYRAYEVNFMYGGIIYISIVYHIMIPIITILYGRKAIC